MYNWSTDEKVLKKDKEKYTVWKLEQMVNFGLNGKKLVKKDLIKHWSALVLDPDRKAFLSLLLYGKNSHRATNRFARSGR